MKKDFIKKIPNILSLLRIILIPIIVIFILLKIYVPAIILIIIGSLTDFIDGKLARYLNCTSRTGAALDTIADKLFVIGIIICLIPKNHSISFILILEILIGSINLYVYLKTKKIKSLMVGKIKTNFLFITVIIAAISIVSNSFVRLFNGFKLATINLQILSLISYINEFININKKKKEDNMEKTIKLDDLKDLSKNFI